MIDIGRKMFDYWKRKISSEFDYMLPRTLLILPFMEAPTAGQGFGENVWNCLLRKK